MQDHQKESKRGHKEIQPRGHMRNDHGIKEPEYKARPIQTDRTS